MREHITPVELSPQAEIQDKPEEGTPRSIDVIAQQRTATGRPYTSTILAIAAATQIFGSPYTATIDDLIFSKDVTPLIDEERPPQWRFVSYGSGSPATLRPDSEAELANRTRLELLARLYVSKKLSAEEDARLAIVTEKVRSLIPRVTADDFIALEEIALESEAIRKENIERRRRLGI